jgi:SpoIIAA-like
VIEAQSFPGWENFAGLVSHLRFVRDHHRKIQRVAVISDSKVLSVAPHLVKHFVAAEIKQFPAKERQAALDWARGRDEAKS